MAEPSFGDIAGRAGAVQDYVSRLVELGVVSVGQGGGFSPGRCEAVQHAIAVPDDGGAPASTTMECGAGTQPTATSSTDQSRFDW
jgi:hypothetical protein